MEKRELKYLSSPKGIILASVAVVSAAVAIFFSFRAARTGAGETAGPSVVTRSGNSAGSDDYSPVMSYKELSYVYGGLSSTGVEWTDEEQTADGAKKGLYFISRDNNQFCIYDADSVDLCGKGYTLDDFDHIWMNSEDEGFYVVVNLAGKNIDLSGYYVLARDSGYTYASRVLVNCFEAETVDLTDSIFTGTLLAPYAHVKHGDNYVFGQVLCDSSEGEPLADREIRFTGYYSVINSQNSVIFANDAVREAAVRYLMEHNTNGLYDRYTESSLLRKSDLDAVKELDLSGKALKDSISQDLAMLTGLEVLDLSFTNVTSLELKDHGYLRELNVSSAPVSSLDLSGAPLLMKLEADGTALRSLDLGANERLEILSLHGTGLGRLPEGSWPELRYLDIGATDFADGFFRGDRFPSLTTLIASGNPELKGVDLSTFAALESIDFSGSGLGELVIPQDSALTYLRLSDTKIKNLDLTPLKHLYVCEIYSEALEELTVNRYADSLYANITPTVVQN